MRLRSLLLCLGLAAAVSGAALAADTVLRWKLSLEPDFSAKYPAARISVKPPKGERQVYWYVIYTVTSTHDQAIPLALHARAATDATEGDTSEGFYPRAMAKIRERHGDDVMDVVSATGHSLAPGQTARVAAVFQFKNDDGSYNDAVDEITVKFQGYADPVKKEGLKFQPEHREYWMTFTRKGDTSDAWKESLRYVKGEEKIEGEGGEALTAN